MKKVELQERKARDNAIREYDLWDVRKHIAFKRKKTFTVLSDETKAVLNEYEVPQKYIKRLWRTFCSLDKRNVGYINVSRILMNISEREYSIIAPFCYRFFELIDKEVQNQVSF